MNFEELKIKQRKENLKILREQINHAWIEKKIIQYLKKHQYLDYTIKEIKQEILNNDIVASFFIKEPTRQNFTEKIIAKELSHLPNFINLKNSDKIYVNEGQIVDYKPIGMKNIDYFWEINGIKYYATQKYTNGNGGAQDNQFHEIVAFVREANKGKTPLNTKFVVIVDGNYYTQSKIQELQSLNANNRVIISSYREVEKYCQNNN